MKNRFGYSQNYLSPNKFMTVTLSLNHGLYFVVMAIDKHHPCQFDLWLVNLVYEIPADR